MSKYFPRITVSTQQSQKTELTCLLFFAAFVFFSEKSDLSDSSTVGRPALNAKIHDVSFFRLGHRKNVCRQVQEPRSSIPDDTPQTLTSVQQLPFLLGRVNNDTCSKSQILLLLTSTAPSRSVKKRQ